MGKAHFLNERGFNPFGDLIGLNFVEMNDGYSKFMLEVDERLYNPHKVLHGGIVYTMADTGMGAALYTKLENDEICATLEIKIMYLKAVTAGKLFCETKIIQKGKRVAFLESEIKNDDNLIAKANGTYSIFKLK
jgi:acyl-CoA thioesterase